MSLSHAHKEDLGDFATVCSSREQVAGSSQRSPGAHKDMTSHLLLRPPSAALSPLFSLQFAMWVDAVIFVFSLEDEISFQTVYHYYSRMANYRNTSEIPLVLVGTQGKCQPCTGVFEGFCGHGPSMEGFGMT